jgi:DNA-binding MarR family transcriptional regulator
MGTSLRVLLRLPHYEATTATAATVFLVGGPDPSAEVPLYDAFWAVARELRQRTHEVVAPFGVTPAQARALGQLVAHGGLRLSELSGSLRIAPRSGTEVVDALEERDLVRRLPDPGDRRATLVVPTAAGREVAAAIGRARHEEAEAFFGGLDEADRAALVRILGELRARTREISRDSTP